MHNINKIDILPNENKLIFLKDISSCYEYYVAENASLKLYQIIQEGQENISIFLNGKNAFCELNILYLGNQNKKINLNTNIIHNASYTQSKQAIKGIAIDKAQINWQGEITILKDKMNCVAKQQHKGILFSNMASIKASPILKIYADKVECAHGSAISGLDEKQLFYCQTKGIPLQQAKKMLLNGFLIENMPLKTHINIQKWIEQNV